MASSLRRLNRWRARAGRHTRCHIVSIAALVATQLIPTWAVADDIPAGPPTDVSVTVYRAPDRLTAGALDLNSLAGFALVSELRAVTLPPGESRIRFQGVADGIDPATVIITGLPTGVLEKNLDAKVLSPSALLIMTLGHNLTLVRTNTRTGKVSRVKGTLRSDADGVVFASATGEIEALRCSGLPETLEFDPISEVRATPTLSAWVRTATPLTATVRLTYLAHGFDWMAHYSAVIAPDGRTMELGGWVTLANGNAVSFHDAHTQVVAGRVNRQTGAVVPVDWGREIIAECWPRGSTSDPPEHPHIARAEPIWDGPARYRLELDDADVTIYSRRSTALYDVVAAPIAAMPAPPPPKAAAAQLVKEEALGDLKLYRVPERTAVASHQAKQVRLLDRQHIPLEHYYGADIQADSRVESITLSHLLRTRNDKAHQLGLPLPAGTLSTFVEHDGAPLLMDESPLPDTALNEELKFDLGDAADVRLSATALDGEGRIDLSNAAVDPVPVEVGLRLAAGERLIHADSPSVLRDGNPCFQVTVPAHGRLSIHYNSRKPLPLSK